jgi:hypothetical protein
VDRQSGKFSGGENQSSYFVAILASYLRAYNRHEIRWRDPSLAASGCRSIESSTNWLAIRLDRLTF